MNKAANIVAESLTGDRFVTIVLKGEGHTVYPPVIKPIGLTPFFLSPAMWSA